MLIIHICSLNRWLKLQKLSLDLEIYIVFFNVTGVKMEKHRFSVGAVRNNMKVITAAWSLTAKFKIYFQKIAN